jgi:hypothetical protein
MNTNELNKTDETTATTETTPEKLADENLEKVDGGAIWNYGWYTQPERTTQMPA